MSNEKLVISDGRPYISSAIVASTVWRKYEGYDWQIEFVSPQELFMALIMDKLDEQYKKVRP